MARRWNEKLGTLAGAGTITLPDGQTMGSGYDLDVFEKRWEQPSLNGGVTIMQGTKSLVGSLVDVEDPHRLPLDGEFRLQLADGQSVRLALKTFPPRGSRIEVHVLGVEQGFRLHL